MDDRDQQELALEESEALKLALANERVAHARLILATHQRELEALALAIRGKYETEERTVTGLDPGRGVVLVQPKNS